VVKGTTYYAFRITASSNAVINNYVEDSDSDGINFNTVNDCACVGNTVRRVTGHGINCVTTARFVCVDNKIDSPNNTNTNNRHGINLNKITYSVISQNSVSNSYSYNVSNGINLSNQSTYNIVTDNNVKDYDIGINMSAASCTNNTVKHNQLNNCVTKFADAGVSTYLASVVVPFVNGTDPQDSGFLVDSTNGGDDYARAFTMLPVEVQQVVRAKVYARSAAAETHSMEADFTVYGAAENEPYNTHNGSAASLASTSVNFAADDVIYWTLTAAGLLAMLGKDSIEAKVDYAAADGDNCATAAYFRTLEIEYV
jgi:hypothetical protein